MLLKNNSTDSSWIRRELYSVVEINSRLVILKDIRLQELAQHSFYVLYL